MLTPPDDPQYGGKLFPIHIDHDCHLLSRVAPGRFQWVRLELAGAERPRDWLPEPLEALTPDGSARFRREGGVLLPDDGAEAAARALGVELGEAVRLEGGAAIILPA